MVASDRPPEELTMDDLETAAAVDTAPPATTSAGVALHGEYPLNSRLRAEAMADADVTTDPDGLITDELIAETRDRLAAERKADADAEEEARRAEAAAPSMKWSEKRLRDEATRLGLTLETDANKAAILAAIQAAPPVETQEG
jgi:hypothetical protein